MLTKDAPKTDIREYSPLAFAFLGDAVYELLVREAIAMGGNFHAGDMHNEAIQYVCASAQSQVYSILEPLLNEKELEILKRGRNASSARIPKNASPMEYRRATGVEALFGYLHLLGQKQRIDELFSVVREQLGL